jgi:hypothetical protein
VQAPCDWQNWFCDGQACVTGQKQVFAWVLMQGVISVAQ